MRFVAPAPIDIQIESLNPAGDGVAAHRGDFVAVPGTIPGERVRVDVSSRPGRKPTARLIEVLRPSPHRVVPRCPHFGACGGCTWQHIAYPEQLRIKTDLVTRLLRAAVPDSPAARPAVTAVPLDNPWGYREKVHFVFGRTAGAGRGGLVMGHYGRGSRQVVSVDACPVHDERGNALAFAFRDRCEAAGIAAAGAVTGGHRARGGGASSPAGVLKGLAIRVGRTTGQMLATLIVSADSDKRLRTATRGLLASTSDITGFHLNVHPNDDGFVFGAETRRIAGERRLREEVGGISFLTSPAAFFQTNVRAADLLVRLVLEAVPQEVPVIDLYAGAGLFAIPLARRGHRVVAVEENRAAVADAEATLRLNRLAADRCRFIARPVEAALRSLDTAEAVVLDPPREGCSTAVVRGIFGTLRPRVAVYVSCDPETLARDLRLASALGYRVDSVQPVDMFPHTPHIETVVVLRR